MEDDTTRKLSEQEILESLIATRGDPDKEPRAYPHEGKTLRGVSEYTLKKGVGRGGMGAIYIAIPNLDRFDYPKTLAFTGERVEEARKDPRRRDYLRLVHDRYKRLSDPKRADSVRKEVEENPEIYPSKGICAIKTLEDPEYQARFTTEWVGFMGINNRENVISVYDGGRGTIIGDNGEEREIHYYAMEFVPDLQTPKKVARLAKRSLRFALEISEKAARGIGELHHYGIIHRDIKPDNILVTRGGLVKVSDIGIAKDVALDFQDGKTTTVIGAVPEILSQERERTQDGTFIGTPIYASPEQALGKPLGIETDMFSLGETIGFWLTGEEPFANVISSREVLRAKAQGIRPYDLRKKRPDLPEKIIQTVERLTKQDPHKRYKTMDEVADIFSDLAKRYGEPPKKTVPRYKTQRRKQAEETQSRRKFLVGLATGFAGLASVGGLVAILRKKPKRHQPEPLVYAEPKRGPTIDPNKFKSRLDDCLEFTRFHKGKLEALLKEAKKARNGEELQEHRRRLERQIEYIDSNVAAAFYFTDILEIKQKKVATDCSGKENHGRIFGDFALRRDRSHKPTCTSIDFQGKKSSGIYFDDSAALIRPPFAISIWTNPSAGLKDSAGLLSSTQYKIHFSEKNIVQTTEGEEIAQPLPLGQWTLIQSCLTRNTSILSVNGPPSKSTELPPDFQPVGPLIIGNSDEEGTISWNGPIDSIEFELIRNP